MGDRLRLCGLQFYAHHGATEGEAENGQRFEVDVELQVDFSQAVDGDLSTIVDYVGLYQIIKEFVTERRYQFLETLVHDLAKTLRERYTKASGGTVVVRKPSVPLGGIITGGSEAETSWGEV